MSVYDRYVFSWRREGSEVYGVLQHDLVEPREAIDLWSAEVVWKKRALDFDIADLIHAIETHRKAAAEKDPT